MQAATFEFQRFFSSATHLGAVGRAIPDGSIVRFELLGPGGGVWCIGRKGAHVFLMDHPHPPPDCRVRCSAEHFRCLLDGTLDPRRGFMTGKLHVAGDVGIVLGLHRAVRRAG